MRLGLQERELPEVVAVRQLLDFLPLLFDLALRTQLEAKLQIVDVATNILLLLQVQTSSHDVRGGCGPPCCAAQLNSVAL